MQKTPSPDPYRSTRRLRAGAAALALACVAVVAFGAPKHKAPKKSAKELRGALHNVRAKIHEQRLQIRATKKKEARITDQIDVVEQRIDRTEAHLREVKDRLAFLKRERKMLTERIAATEKRLQERRRILAGRVRDNYTRGNTTYVHVLLASRSFHDYLSRSYYVHRIVDSDVKLIDGVKADERQLEADKRKLEAETAEQASLRSTYESERAQYAADADTKRDMLHDVQETRESMEQVLDQLEQSSNEIESRIQAMQQTPQGRQRMQHAWHGSFIKPAAGPIMSGFGMRFHPILHRSRMHTGVDIGAHYGASIHAAGGGVVIMSGRMNGYGNVVIIDHGGGVSTLYAHCSALLVSEGQSVRQGQVVARVGSTGLATGPHLHFEVRHNGHPVNPM